MSAPSDTRTMVVRARKGDASAFADLVRRTRDRVYGILCAILCDPAEAEDAAQEVYLAAYRGLGDLREEEKFRAWADGIARRIGRNRYGKLKRERENRTSDAGDPASPDPGPVETLSRKERERVVAAGLERLPNRDREALLMRYQEGLAVKEIAERLEITEENAYVVLFRARKRFAEGIASSGEGI